LLVSAGSAPPRSVAATVELPPRAQATSPQDRIQHVVIIFQENRTPDNLFQGLPGADIQSFGYDARQRKVPLVPVALASSYDIDHGHPQFLAAFNEGKMNGWQREPIDCPTRQCPGATPFGYVPASQIGPYLTLAATYTFADRMFQSNQGPSFPAHQFIIAGTSADSPTSVLLAAENPVYYGNDYLNCGGSALTWVRMIDPLGLETRVMHPCFDHLTMFDLLDAKKVSWRYYESYIGRAWSAPDAIAHIRYGPDWSDVSFPSSNVLSDIARHQLPSVSWVIPPASASDHARVNNGSGPTWVATIVNAIGESSYWNNTAIFISWDDWGGWYDHVRPPLYNSYELGFRVPLIVVSPYARPGYVSHVQHEFGSILHFIEETYGLGSLGYTDVRADDLSDCFNFSQPPIVYRPISTAGLPPVHLGPEDESPDND